MKLKACSEQSSRLAVAAAPAHASIRRHRKQQKLRKVSVASDCCEAGQQGVHEQASSKMWD